MQTWIDAGEVFVTLADFLACFRALNENSTVSNDER